MANIKNPCFSLGARGSINKSITFTKRRGVDIAEKKPELPCFLTLPVQYQRWLYQDYAYLWTQQSIATKQTYAARGVRHHLTGFQYWMKDRLTTLPDIVAWWKLDEGSGAIAYDSGKENNPGLIVGCTPITGPIGAAYLFDGINDQIIVPNSPSLDLLGPFSIEFLARPLSWLPDVPLLGKAAGADRYIVMLRAPANILAINIRINNVGFWAVVDANPPLGAWFHYEAVYNMTDIRSYVNGVLQAQITPCALNLIPNASNLLIGSNWFGANPWWDGEQDNIIIRNRAVDATEVIRHSERRYP